MTRTIFEDWLKRFDEKMEKENRRALLLVDNFILLMIIRIQLLPANTTAVIQPTDAGVIAN